MFVGGIFFVRRLDGVDIDGIVKGGVFISFDEDAKIAELKIAWRVLEPFELCRTLTLRRFVRGRRSVLFPTGRSVFRRPSERSGRRLVKRDERYNKECYQLHEREHHETRRAG